MFLIKEEQTAFMEQNQKNICLQKFILCGTVTSVKGRKQIIFTGFWSKVLDFFYNWYIDSVCEDKALHQVWRQNVN